MQHARRDLDAVKQRLHRPRLQQRRRQRVQLRAAGQAQLMAQPVLPEEFHPGIRPGIGLGRAADGVVAGKAKLVAVGVLRRRHVHQRQLAAQLGCRNQQAPESIDKAWI